MGPATSIPAELLHLISDFLKCSFGVLCPRSSTRWGQRLPNRTAPLLTFHFSTRYDWRFKDRGGAWSEWRRRGRKHLTKWPQWGPGEAEGGGCGRETRGDSAAASETSQHFNSIQPACQTAHQTGQPRWWVNRRSRDVKLRLCLPWCLTPMVFPPRYPSSAS